MNLNFSCLTLRRHDLMNVFLGYIKHTHYHSTMLNSYNIVITFNMQKNLQRIHNVDTYWPLVGIFVIAC